MSRQDKIQETFFAGIHAQVDKMVDDQCAEAGQIPLGELAALLRACDQGKPVILDCGGTPGDLSSYRGHYWTIAIEPDLEERECTVRELLQKVNAAINTTFEGYKGGDYKMTRSTMVWVSGYGEVSGLGVVGVSENDERVAILTATVES